MSDIIVEREGGILGNESSPCFGCWARWVFTGHFLHQKRRANSECVHSRKAGTQVNAQGLCEYISRAS